MTGSERKQPFRLDHPKIASFGEENTSGRAGIIMQINQLSRFLFSPVTSTISARNAGLFCSYIIRPCLGNFPQITSTHTWQSTTIPLLSPCSVFSLFLCSFHCHHTRQYETPSLRSRFRTHAIWSRLWILPILRHYFGGVFSWHMSDPKWMIGILQNMCGSERSLEAPQLSLHPLPPTKMHIVGPGAFKCLLSTLTIT